MAPFSALTLVSPTDGHFHQPKAKQVKEVYKFLKKSKPILGKMTTCEVGVKVEDDQSVFWLNIGAKKECDKTFRVAKIVVVPLEE